MPTIEIFSGKDCDKVAWLKFLDKQRTKELIIAFQFYSTLPASIQDFWILGGNIKLVTQTSLLLCWCCSFPFVFIFTLCCAIITYN